MGELVHERDLEPDAHLGAADAHPLVGGVVERERAAVGHLVEGVEQVELAGRDPKGPELGRRTGRGPPARRRLTAASSSVVWPGVLLGGEEVDVDGMLELEAPLVLDERRQVAPRVASHSSGCAGSVVGELTGQDGHRTQHQEADDDDPQRRGPASGSRAGSSGGGGRWVHALERGLPCGGRRRRQGRRRREGVPRGGRRRGRGEAHGGGGAGSDDRREGDGVLGLEVVGRFDRNGTLGRARGPGCACPAPRWPRRCCRRGRRRPRRRCRPRGRAPTPAPGSRSTAWR